MVQLSIMREVDRVIVKLVQDRFSIGKHNIELISYIVPLSNLEWGFDSILIQACAASARTNIDSTG